MEACRSFRKKEKETASEQPRSLAIKHPKGSMVPVGKVAGPALYPDLEWVPSSVSHVSSWKISD